jgi:hypothetical protein
LCGASSISDQHAGVETSLNYIRVRFPVVFLYHHYIWIRIFHFSIEITHQVIKMQFAYLTVLSCFLAIGIAAPVAQPGQSYHLVDALQLTDLKGVAVQSLNERAPEPYKLVVTPPGIAHEVATTA